MAGDTAQAAGGEKKARYQGCADIDIGQMRQLFCPAKNAVIIYKRPYSTVAVIGRILEAEYFETRSRYVIQDHTGPPITVNLWNQSQPTNVPVGTYARVFGMGRMADDGTLSMVGYHIEQVKSVNDLVEHYISQLRDNAALAKRAENIDAGLAVSCENFPDSQLKSTFVQKPISQGRASYSASASMAPAAAVPVGGVSGLSAQQNAVLSMISKSNEDMGISLNSLNEALKSIGAKQIKTIVDFLSAEGHIYTTIDENHFKATDS